MNRMAILPVALSLLVGGLCYSAEPNKEEAAAIAYFEKIGGEVKVFRRIFLGKPVMALHLSRSKISDDGLRHLKKLSKLRELYFDFKKNITDAGLAHLKGLTKLQVLSLWGTKFTDEGLVHLEGLIELQKLHLDESSLSDAGLVHLRKLTKLQVLSLSGTKITDAGLVNLKGLSELHSLNLCDTKISDAGGNGSGSVFWAGAFDSREFLFREPFSFVCRYHCDELSHLACVYG